MTQRASKQTLISNTKLMWHVSGAVRIEAKNTVCYSWMNGSKWIDVTRVRFGGFVCTIQASFKGDLLCKINFLVIFKHSHGTPECIYQHIGVCNFHRQWNGMSNEPPLSLFFVVMLLQGLVLHWKRKPKQMPSRILFKGIHLNPRVQPGTLNRNDSSPHETSKSALLCFCKDLR